MTLEQAMYALDRIEEANRLLSLVAAVYQRAGEEDAQRNLYEAKYVLDNQASVLRQLAYAGEDPGIRRGRKPLPRGRR